MKRRIISVSIAVALLTVIAAATVSLQASDAGNAPYNAASEADAGNTDANQPGGSSAEDVYVIKDHNGYIAVFMESGGNTPFFTSDVSVSTLRSTDRRQLKTGIRVTGYYSMLRLLEDFSK